MNIMPFLMDFTETFSDMMNYENEYDDDFGFLVYPHEIHRRVHRPARLQMYSTRRLPYNVGGVKNLTTTPITKSKIDIEKNGGTNSSYYPTIGKNGFQVCMNVQQFKPNELTVKMIENTVIVEGKHDEREDDNGLISRQFTRKYNLPKGYNPNDVISTLSSDGILTIKSPLPVKIQDCAERIVQIQHTGPAYLSVKDNPKATTITTTTTTIPIITNNVNPTTNNLMMNSNKNSTPNMNSIPIINNNNNNSNSNLTTTTTTTTNNNTNNNNNNNTAVETNNTPNPDVPTIIIQKEKNDNVAVIKEKCENGEKSENDKIIEKSNEAIIED